MKLTIAALEEQGGIVAAEPIKTELTWRDQVYDIFILRKSAETMNRIRRTATDGMDRNALLISAFVRLGETGEEDISYETALKLDDDLQIAILKAVNDAFEARADPKN